MYKNLKLDYIHSFWSLPHRLESVNGKVKITNSSWLDLKYTYFSLAFSALTILENLGNLLLYTDHAGCDLLIDKLDLPYTKVINRLDELNSYSSKLWPISKLFVISEHDSPFIHIDTDVFIFDNSILNLSSSLAVCQNLTYNYPGYRELITYMTAKFRNIPKYWDSNTDEDIISVNSGIIGGNDKDRLNRFGKEMIYFVNSNLNEIEQCGHKGINMIFDQYLYYLNFKDDLNPYLKNISNTYNEVLCWHKIPWVKYLHLLGYSKRNSLACIQLEYRLAFSYPKVYSKIVEYLGAKSVLIQNHEIRDALFGTYSKLRTCHNYKELLNIPIVIDNKVRCSKYDKLEGQKGGMIYNLLFDYFSTPKTLNDLLNYLVQNNYVEYSKLVVGTIADYMLMQMIYYRRFKFC